MEDYLPSAEILGVDLDPNVMVNENRISSCYGDQLNPFGLANVKAFIKKEMVQTLFWMMDCMNMSLMLMHLFSFGSTLSQLFISSRIWFNIFTKNLNFLRSLNIDATIYGAELQSK